MYKIRKFLKGLGYSLVYLLISIASAYGVINLSISNVRGETQTGADTPLPEQISSMVEHFSASSALDLDLNAIIEADGNNYEIGLDAVVDLSNGLENIKAEGSINAIIGSSQTAEQFTLSQTEQNQTIQVEFSYQNNHIFIDMMNGKLMLESTNLMESINEILAFANVDLESMGVSEILNMPINDMLKMLSNIKEEVKDETTGLISMVVALPMVGDATLICDENYKLLGLYSDMEISEGLNVKVSSGIDYPTNLVIEDKPTEEYVNAGNLLSVVNPLLKYIENTQYALDIDVTNQTQAGEYKTVGKGKLYLDINEKMAQFNINVLGNEAKLYFLNNTIYIEYQNVFAKFAFEDLGQVQNLLQNAFDIILPQEVIDTINSLLNGEPLELPNGMDFSGFDMGSLDLSIVDSVEIKNDSTLITIKDVGVVRINAKDGTLNEIAYSGFGYQALAKVMEYQEFSLSMEEKNYIDLATLIPTIENAISILDCNTIDGSINLSLAGHEFDINFKADLSSVQAHLYTQIFDFNINIFYQDGKIFVNVEDKFKFVCNVSTFVDDMLEFLSKIGIDMSQDGGASITDKIAILFNPNLTPMFVTSLEETTNGFNITLFNDTTISIENESKAIQLSTAFNEMFVNASIYGSDNEYVAPQINEDEYTDTSLLLNIAEKVYKSGILKLITPALNSFSSNTIGLEIQTTLSNEAVTLFANINLATKAMNITSSVYDLDVSIIYKDSQFYLEAGNIYLTFALSDFDKVVILLEEQFGIALPAEIVDLLLEFINAEKVDIKKLLNEIDFDIEKLDLSILDKISVSENKAIVELGDNEITINFNESEILSVDFDGIISASATLSTYCEKSLSTSKENYVDIVSFIPTIENINAIVHSNKVFGRAILNHNNISIDAEVVYNNQQGTAIIKTEFEGINIEMYVQENKLYINIADKFKFISNMTSFIDDVAAFLNKINVELTSPDTNEALKALINLLSPSVNPLLIKSFKTTSNGMIITLFNDFDFAIVNAGDEVAINSSFEEGSIFLILKTTTKDVVLPEIVEEEYCNTTHILNLIAGAYNAGLTKLITPTLNTFADGEIAINLTLPVSQETVNATANISLVNKTLSLTGEFNNIGIKLIYTNAKFYIELGNLYFQVGLANFEEISDFLNNNFGVELPNELILKLINIVTAENISFADMLEDFELNFNLADIDLSIFENIAVTDAKATITLGENNISINFNEEKILGFEFNNIGGSISTYENISLSREEKDYINLTSLLPIIENTLNFIKYDVISGSIKTTIENQDIEATFSYSQADNKAIVSTEIMGIALNIFFENNTVYVNLADKFKLSSSTSTFISDITSFLNEMGLNTEVDMSGILTAIESLLNPANNSLLIKEFISEGDLLMVTLFNDMAFNINHSSDMISLSTQIQNTPAEINLVKGIELTLPEIIKEDYTDINILLNIVSSAHKTGLTNLLAPVLNTFKNANLGATFTIEYDDLSISGHLSINAVNLSAGVNVNVRGVDVNIIILPDDVVYIEFGNVYAKFAIADLPSVGEIISKHFYIDLPLDVLVEILAELREGSFNAINLLDKFDITLDLEAFDLAFFDSIIKNENTFLIPVDGIGNFKIGANETLTEFGFEGFGINLNAQINEYKVFDLTLLKEEYVDLADLLPTIDNAISVVEYNTLSGQIVINDLKSRINIPIEYVIAKDSEIYIAFSTSLNGANLAGKYYNEKVYLEFAESVKIVVDVLNLPNALKEVMDSAGKNIKTDLFVTIQSILDSLLKSKTSSIISTAVGMFDSIKSIFNKTTTEMLIKSLKQKDNGFTITLYNDMLIDINNSPTQLDISTAIGETELSINLNGSTETISIPTINENDYIPMENILELVKAFFNMTHKDDFNIQGNIDIAGDLIGININMNVGVNAQVKLVDGKVQFQAILGEIPAIVGVNNDVPYKFGDTESGSDRYVYLYFDGNDLYIYRNEYVDVLFGASKRQYEKCTKISVNTLLSDPMYYLQYMIGFSDAIMGAIEDAMLKAQNREAPINLNNVVNSLACNGETFNLILNLAEIANNNLLDTLDLNLLLNRDYEDKSYLYRLGLDVYLPLADIFKLTLSSDDITIVDYGSTVDMSRLQQYVTNYKYNYGEEWEASNGSWGKAADRQYTIYFEENGGDTQADISGVYGSPITLPVYTNSIVTDDGVTKTTATFAGWYTSSKFKEGTLFTATTMPRKDTVLYAKWNKEVLYYRTIKFVTNSEEQINSITQLEGSTVIVPYLNTKQVTNGDITTTYSFGGWYLDSTCKEKFTDYKMPTQSIVLYAKWDFVKEEVTKTFSLVDNGQQIYTYKIQEGDQIDLSGVNKVSLHGDKPTLFYTDSNCTSAYTGDFIMPNADLTLYIKNAYTLTIYSQYGNVVNTTVKLYQGETFTLPSQSSQYIEDDYRTKQVTYTFNGYKANGKVVSSTVMPNNDLNIVADWGIVTKKYYTITFSKDTDASGGYKDKIVFSDNTTTNVLFLEGTTVNLSNYTATWKYNPFGWWHHKFYGWSTKKSTSSNDVISSITISGNVTIYAVWSWDAKAGKG